MSTPGDIQSMYAQLLAMEEELRRVMGALDETGEKAKQTQITLKYSEMFFAIQRFIQLVQQAIIVTKAFYAASGPVGWVILASGAAGIALTYGDTLAGYV
jgi:hypothetical protein